MYLGKLIHVYVRKPDSDLWFDVFDLTHKMPEAGTPVFLSCDMLHSNEHHDV